MMTCLPRPMSEARDNDEKETKNSTQGNEDILDQISSWFSKTAPGRNSSK